jgi:hypothetical protein
MEQENIVDVDEFFLAKGEETLPENFPELFNISAGLHFLEFIPRPVETYPPEFVYIPLDGKKSWLNKRRLLTQLTITNWNVAWEAGHLRSQFIPQVFRTDLPNHLRFLTKYDANLYLIPDDGRSNFEAFAPLYHLLPLSTLQRFGLPVLNRGLWPPFNYNEVLHSHIQKGFDERLSKAFASHVWPLIDSGSGINAFSRDESLVVLTHNLNYWLPCVYKLAEDRLRSFSRVEFDSLEQIEQLERLRSTLPADVEADRPLRGGAIWCGEQEAWDATNELVEIADEHGQLRGIIDAVRSNRVQDDFSNRWSYAKEDFERKLYRKRTKTQLTFVELDEAKPVHAPTSEVHENLLWEDFITLLNPKERRIVVFLKMA